jgi:hypothetical protein
MSEIQFFVFEQISADIHLRVVLLVDLEGELSKSQFEKMFLRKRKG